MLARTSWNLLLVALAVTTACQGADVGQECRLSWGNDPSSTAPMASELAAKGGADYVEFNAANECENLLCIVSPAPAGNPYALRARGVGYCSKPCVSDRDCYQSATGLVCRNIVLDPDFIATLPQSTKDKYLGDLQQYATYCAIAR